MILLLSNRVDPHVDLVADFLDDYGVEFFRWNIDDAFQVELAPEFSTLSCSAGTLRSSDVRAIWWRRPSRRFVAIAADDPIEAEYERMELWDSMEAFADSTGAVVVPGPYHTMLAADRRVNQLRRASSLGFTVPDWIVTNSVDAAREFVAGGSTLVKRAAGGMPLLERSDEALSISVYASAVLAQDLPERMDSPSLFQRAVMPKVDVRSIVMPPSVRSFAIRSRELDYRMSSPQGRLEIEPLETPEEIRAKVCELTTTYGLRYSAVDFVVDQKGTWGFLEINPNGQFAFLDPDNRHGLLSDFTKYLVSVASG